VTATRRDNASLIWQSTLGAGDGFPSAGSNPMGEEHDADDSIATLHAVDSVFDLLGEGAFRTEQSGVA
jgi:hypothetical protein